MRYAVFHFLAFICMTGTVFAQTDAVLDARAAMAKGEYARAVNILSPVVSRATDGGTAAPADAYLYLGISYAHVREWMNAETTLKLGAEKFPSDSRFHNELAGVYLAANDLDRARGSLRTSLAVAPDDKYASDLLATIDMSMGNVHAALDAWNRQGHPIVSEILHNAHLTPENWIVQKAAAFKTEEMLTWGNWRTSEERLWRSGIFSNVGLEIEPTPSPDRYTAVIRTSEKVNKLRDTSVNLFLETLLYRTPALRWWNLKNTGINLTSSYRFSRRRHQAEVGLDAPLPLPGLLFIEARGFWRGHQWDTSRIVRQPTDAEQLNLTSTGFRAMVRHIPNYRFELAAGFEYRNRREQSGTSVDRRDTGKWLFEAVVRPTEGRYQTRLRVQGFLARPGALSDMDYSGGTAELRNRFVLNPDRATYVDVSLKGGTSRGNVPIDDYFVLGLKYSPENFLRGHNAVSTDNRYGNAPMGTEFVLVNTSIERRFRRLPLFNTLNVPYVDLKWEVFLDGGKTFDRAGVFQQGKLFIDVGGGFKLETPDRAYHFTYGRSLRDGSGVFAAYVEKRW